jgi:hypothetical protein
MKFYPRPSPVIEEDKHTLTITIPSLSWEKLKKKVWLLVFILLSNWMTYHWSVQPKTHESNSSYPKMVNESLYLFDKAEDKLSQPENFAYRVREIAQKLQIPASWLMAVMYAESGFDPNVFNRKGSGAVGLIQFMPTTAGELGVEVSHLARMNAHDQLEYVFRYFEMVKDRYGAYQSLTDFYLAVLYPKARNQDTCYTLYASPSQAYTQNQGLDENRDGRVTVSDIDKRMKRLFPKAYQDLLPEVNT